MMWRTSFPDEENYAVKENDSFSLLTERDGAGMTQSGNIISNTTPRLSRRLHPRIVPPCASISCLPIESPNPVPFSLPSV